MLTLTTGMNEVPPSVKSIYDVLREYHSKKRIIKTRLVVMSCPLAIS